MGLIPRIRELGYQVRERPKLEALGMATVAIVNTSLQRSALLPQRPERRRARYRGARDMMADARHVVGGADLA